MLARNLTLKSARCGRESLHWDLLKQVINLKTETCSGWWETWYGDMVTTMTTLHWDLLRLVRNLIRRHGHDDHNLTLRLTHVGETLQWDLLMLVIKLKVTQCCWKSLPWNIRMVVRNFTLIYVGDKLYTGLTDAGDKPYTGTYLQYANEKSYTESRSCWYQTLY